MTVEHIDLRPPRGVPWWVWVALVPAVLIGLNQLRKGGRQRIELAGAGPVHTLGFAEVPEDLRFYPDTVAREGAEASAARILEGLVIQPAVFVFGLDLSSWDPERTPPEVMQERYAELMRRAENAATVPVSVGPWVAAAASAEQRAAVSALSAWWRRGPCARAVRLLCVQVDGLEGEALEARMQAGVRSGVRRLSGLRAATQRSR